MKKALLLLFFTLISVFTFSKEKLVIGVIYDGKTEKNEKIGDLIKKEVVSLVGSKYEVSFPEDKQLVDSFNRNDISKKMDQLLEDDEVDVVIAGGILSSYIAIHKDNIKKPLFAPFIINNTVLNDKKGNSSGKKNLNFISTDLDIKAEIENYRKIKDFKKLKILIGEETLNIMPEISPFLDLYLKSNNVDVDFQLIKVGDNLSNIYDELRDAEAVAISDMKNIDPKKVALIVEYANNKKIPTFSTAGSDNLNIGILAGHSYEKELKKRIRGMAVNLTLYLEGKEMEDLPVYFEAAKSELIINMAVVEKTGIWPSWDVISESKLINFVSEEDSAMSLSLKEVLDIALKNNSQIKALREEVKTAELNIKKAKSNYKPDLDANATGVVIDEDRADSVFSPAEQTLSVGVSLTQVIFSEDLNMSVDVKKKQKELKNEELKKAELDLVLEASEAYFTVLKAEAYARIQKTNLELTKNNLDIAKSRKEAGTSGPADVYRWESQLANSVSSLIESMLNVNIAKTNLKRIINYNLNEELDIKTIELSYSEFLINDKEILKYISNQNKVNILIKYMTKIALENSPELRSLENGIDIQKRLVKNATNKRFMPTVALQAKYTINNLIKEGEGSEDPDYSSIGSIPDPNTQKALGDILGSFGNPDDNEWSVGIGVSLPIYSGGEISTDKKIAEQEIETLNYNKEAMKQFIEQRIINYVLQMVSEYSKINTAKVSVESATKALNLVKDAYSRGIVSVSELMDAQTSAISAEQYQSTVTYDMMTAILRTERSIGSYYMYSSDEEKAQFKNELEKIN